MYIKVKKLSENAQLPKASHPEYCLGYDLYASEPLTIGPGGRGTVNTGVAVEALEENSDVRYGFLLRERSGQGKVGIKLLGGVIDADYRGEIMVMLINLGPDTYYINQGDRIAQMIPVPVYSSYDIGFVNDLSDTERGDKGFGSTGK